MNEAQKIAAEYAADVKVSHVRAAQWAADRAFEAACAVLSPTRYRPVDGLYREDVGEVVGDLKTLCALLDQLVLVLPCKPAKAASMEQAA